MAAGVSRPPTNVLVLGGSGMLGAMVVDLLSRDASVAVSATVRDPFLLVRMNERIPGVRWDVFDAESTDPDGALFADRRFDWIVNAIGVIKPHIREDAPRSVERAVRVNTLFPSRLAEIAEREGMRVLQIATDCVYSGTTGGYHEDALHDPTDVYGKTKSLGEVRSEYVHHLRCSIVGPEPRRGVSLMEWFLGQPSGSEVGGFVNHRWNGVTTLQFARVCAGIVREDRPPFSHCAHLVPRGEVTKAELLELLAAAFGRSDIRIERKDAPTALDRTLSTSFPETARALWRDAGYAEAPDTAKMLEELRAYPFRLRAV